MSFETWLATASEDERREAYENALESYEERHAEIGSEFYLDTRNASDANLYAWQVLGPKPTREDYNLPEDPFDRAQGPLRGWVPAEDDDLPF